MLVYLPLNIRHFKQIAEQITVRLNLDEKQSCWRSTELINTDVKTTNALSPSNLLTQIHRANNSLVTCIMLQLQSMIVISMGLISLVDFRKKILLDKDKQLTMWKRADKPKHYKKKKKSPPKIFLIK